VKEKQYRLVPVVATYEQILRIAVDRYLSKLGDAVLGEDRWRK
jgi:hypothetical protein